MKDILYEFYFPDDSFAESFYWTEKEVNTYNLIAQELMDIAMNYYEAHKDQYKNVMEVYDKCYYVQKTIDPALGQFG